jgi:nucleotide-binding universal stress UspA family protein
MKIVAAFDGSTPPETIVASIEWLAQVPGVRLTFLSFAGRQHGTRQGRRATRPVAAGFAGSGGTPITVPAVPAVLVENRGQAIDRALTEHREYLEDVVALMPRGPEYVIDTAVATDPARAIASYAREHAVDLIVMGSHGEGGVLQRLFGDVADEVVHLSHVPVLLVRSG